MSGLCVSPLFRKLIAQILVFSNGFTAHLYHDVTNVARIHQKIKDFDRFDVVNETEKEQTVLFFNSALVMAMEGMLCRVFGVEYYGETKL